MKITNIKVIATYDDGEQIVFLDKTNPSGFTAEGLRVHSSRPAEPHYEAGKVEAIGFIQTGPYKFTLELTDSSGVGRPLP